METKNIIIRAIKEKNDENRSVGVPPEMIRIVYDSTSEPCSIKSLMIDLFTYAKMFSKDKDKDKERWREGAKDLPQEFRMDLTIELMTRDNRAYARWNRTVDHYLEGKGKAKIEV